MSGDERTYRFLPVVACNMCGEPTAGAKIVGRRLNVSQGLRPTKKAGIGTTVMRCRSCDLVFANPQPIPTDIAQHYGVPPEDYWAGRYVEDEGGDFLEHEINTFFRLWSGDRQPVALDVGAGLGKGMRALVNRGFDAYGLEASEPFQRAAVERASIAADRLICSTVEDANYPAGTFDFITFGAVLEHLADPATALERALRWLTPHGLIQIDVPSSRWLTNSLVNLVYRAQGLDYCANISPMHVPYHLYEFSFDSFRAHGARVGYAVAHARRHVADESYLPAPLGLFARQVMARTGTGMQLEVWLSRNTI